MSLLLRTPEGSLTLASSPAPKMPIPATRDPLSSSLGSQGRQSPGGPAFDNSRSVESVGDLRVREAHVDVRGHTLLPSTLPLDERKKLQSRLHHRRRSSEVLDVLESGYGDVPVQRPSGAPLLHAATVLYGKPSEIGNDGMVRRDAGKRVLMNVQAPLRAKSRGGTSSTFSSSASGAMFQFPSLATAASEARLGASATRPLTSSAQYGKHKDLRDFSLQFHLTRKEVASRSSARQEALEARATLTPLVPSFLDIPADLSSSYMPEAPQSSPTLTRTRSPTGFLSGTIPDTLTLTHHGLDAVVAEGAAAHLNGTSVALAHLNKSGRASSPFQESYLKFATRTLAAVPEKVRYGFLRFGAEYCLPITLKNNGLLLKRFRVASLFLEPGSPKGRLRCRYAPLKLAPGTTVDILIIFRGDEAGHVKGCVELDSEDGTLQIPVTAEVLTAVEFGNAIAKYTKPKGEEGEESEVDPTFKDYIVPGGKTNRLVVPVLPL